MDQEEISIALLRLILGNRGTPSFHNTNSTVLQVIYQDANHMHQWVAPLQNVPLPQTLWPLFPYATSKLLVARVLAKATRLCIWFPHGMQHEKWSINFTYVDGKVSHVSPPFKAIGRSDPFLEIELEQFVLACTRISQ